MGNTTKLTLSAEIRIVEKAKRLARKRRTSVSAMFAQYVEEQAESAPAGPPNAQSLTGQAAGLIHWPKHRDEQKTLQDALIEKYGLGK